MNEIKYHFTKVRVKAEEVAKEIYEEITKNQKIQYYLRNKLALEDTWVRIKDCQKPKSKYSIKASFCYGGGDQSYSLMLRIIKNGEVQVQSYKHPDSAHYVRMSVELPLGSLHRSIVIEDFDLRKELDIPKLLVEAEKGYRRKMLGE